MALADDPGAKKALDGVHAAMTDTDRCRSVPLEALVTKASAIQSLEQWAASFDQRYIDLSPIS